MPQPSYTFDYQYSGYITQLVDILSKVQDVNAVLERSMEVLARITRYKYALFLEKGAEGLMIPDRKDSPKPQGFRAPHQTELGQEIRSLTQSFIEKAQREQYIHVNEIKKLGYKNIAAHPDIGALLIARIIDDQGYDYGTVVFGCESPQILNTFELSLIECFISRLTEIFKRDHALLKDRQFIWGESDAMQEVRRIVEKVAATDANVLIQGESGTGKELIARMIHQKSRQKDHIFVDVNCAALPETLLESELFGHEKGAFTGAIYQKIGKFELAHRGTLFLDEVGDTSLSMQVKMLRVLQEGEFTRVGGNDKIQTAVRVISATNQNLKQLIEQGKFRKDLYYRLNVIPISIPPLRERREDILYLVEHFLRKFSLRLGIQYQISERALERLMQFPWAGNVRELENFIERTVTLSSSTIIDLQDIKLEPIHENGEAHWDFKGPISPLRAIISRIRKAYCNYALDAHHGNKSQTAKALGISRLILNKYLKGTDA